MMLVTLLISAAALVPVPTAFVPVRYAARTSPLHMYDASPDEPVNEGCDAEEKYCTTASGVKYLDQKVGQGEEATADGKSVVRIAYVASLLSDGREIGSTKGMRAPMRFAMGDGRLLFWEEAVEGMRVGGTRRLLVPPSAKMQLRAANQRALVPDGETVRFDCELLAIETGAAALAVRSGLLGAASNGGRNVRRTVLLLSLIPYLLPESMRPGLWRSGSSSQMLTEAGLIPERPDDAPPSLPEERRMMRAERKEDSSLFGADIERELYGRGR